MPSTVNGIGTWYYGKSNLVTRNDTCEFCQNYGELKSYDTTLYFVVVFVPLIPLGRKRIINECRRCRKHRAAKLSDWEKRKTDAILQAAQAWQHDPRSSVKAMQAVAPTIAYHDPESFRQIAANIGDAFPKDADVQIDLGDAYDHFGETQPADTAYRAAVVIRPDEKSKEALGKFLIRQSRPAEAQPLLDHLLANRVRAKAPLLLALAQSYQAVGDHAAAETLVDDIGTAFPDLLSDPNYEKVRRNASKYRGTTKRVGGKKTYDGAKETSWFSRHAGAAIFGGIALVAAIWYLGLAYSLGTHSVSLVNGTAKPYAVSIGAKSFTIPAMSSVQADLDEGTYNVSVPTMKDVIAPAKIDLHTNFWKRPLNRRTFVINPDRAAVVLWEQTEYADSPAKGGETPHHFHAGDVFYDLDKTDYLFESFPDSLKMSSKNDVIKKTRVDLLRKYSPEVLGRIVKSQIGAPAAAQWAKQYAVVSEDPIEAVTVLSEELTPKEQVDFLRAHVADRPIRIEWHRLYQQTVQTEQPDFDLSGEYRGLLKADPENPVLTYLLARTLDDRDEATALFSKAAEGPPPCAYALYALSHDDLTTGHFESALQRMRAARKLEPNNILFENAEADTLEALGQYAEAIAIIKSMSKHPGRDYALVVREIPLLVAKGDVPAAKARIDAFCTEIDATTGGDQEARATARNMLEAYLYYATGDMAGFRKSALSMNTPDFTFSSAMTDGRIEEAQKALAEVKSPDNYEAQLLYIGAKVAGKNDIADAAWTQSMDLMKKGDRNDRIFARVLASSQPPAEKDLRNWVAQPVERAVMLTALGLRYPEKHAEYFAAAQKLNFANRFPQRLIAKVAGAKS